MYDISLANCHPFFARYSRGRSVSLSFATRKMSVTSFIEVSNLEIFFSTASPNVHRYINDEKVRRKMKIVSHIGTFFLPFYERKLIDLVRSGSGKAVILF